MIVATSTPVALLILFVIFSTLAAGIAYAIDDFGRIIARLEEEDATLGAGQDSGLDSHAATKATITAAGADTYLDRLIDEVRA